MTIMKYNIRHVLLAFSTSEYQRSAARQQFELLHSLQNSISLVSTLNGVFGQFAYIAHKNQKALFKQRNMFLNQQC